MNETVRGIALAACLLACDAAGDAPIAMGDAPAEAAATRAAAAECRLAGSPSMLPQEVPETSGLARGRRDPDLFWTHNDAGGEPVIYAVDGTGALRARVRVRGASQHDWEDMDAGPCASGDCLFVGDIGDNQRDREHVTIYRFPEPAAGDAESGPAVALRARYPGGPRNAEAMFILPSGDIHIVTKGDDGAIELYRFRAPQRPDTTATLELIRGIAPEAGERADRVTGAGASPDGRWVAIRTYGALDLYPAEALVSGSAVQPERIDLTPFDEPQGEAVALGDDGSVWLTSEAPDRDGRATWLHLACSLPAPR